MSKSWVSWRVHLGNMSELDEPISAKEYSLLFGFHISTAMCALMKLRKMKMVDAERTREYADPNFKYNRFYYRYKINQHGWNRLEYLQNKIQQL